MRSMRVVAALAALLSISAPVLAQGGSGFSDSYNFLKAVRDKDAYKAQQIARRPGSTVVNTRDFTTGEQALHIVTKRRDYGFMQLLLFNGAAVDGADKERNTPLILAATLAFPDGVRLLLSRKANVNAANAAGETALIKAVQALDAASARLLLDAGADPDKTDNVAGLSARDYAERDRRASAIARLIKDGTKKTAAPVQGPSL